MKNNNKKNKDCRHITSLASLQRQKQELKTELENITKLIRQIKLGSKDVYVCVGENIEALETSKKHYFSIKKTSGLKRFIYNAVKGRLCIRVYHIKSAQDIILFLNDGYVYDLPDIKNKRNPYKDVACIVYNSILNKCSVYDTYWDKCTY